MKNALPNFNIEFIQNFLGSEYSVRFGKNTKRRIYIEKNNKRLMIIFDGWIVTYFKTSNNVFEKVNKPVGHHKGEQECISKINSIQEGLEIIKKIL